MKRLNYYEAHKNKKPKVKKEKKYVSLLYPFLAMQTAISASQIHILQSQQTLSYKVKEDKNLSIISTIKDTMFAYDKIFKAERQRRFKLTGRYT